MSVSELRGASFCASTIPSLTLLSISVAPPSVRYNKALADQPANELLTHSAFKAIGAGLFLAGQVFVLSSMWALGFTGTYLGDYFGILMESMVTGFPFNVMGDPMYWGSSMCFAGVALWCVVMSALLARTLRAKLILLYDAFIVLPFLLQQVC